MSEIPEHSQEENHKSPAMNIGLFIGAVLFIIGAILVLYGLLGSPENERSLGINLNLWWGLFMAVFGGAFFGISHAVARHRVSRDARV